MVLDTSKLIERYYSGMLMPLRQSLIWTSLCNRNYQADFVAGAYTVKIPTALTDRDATTVQRNANWIAATDADLNYVEQSITQQTMMASSIPYLDEVQTPVSLIDRERSIHTRGFANAIDKFIAGKISSAVPAANRTDTYPKLANQPYLTAAGRWTAANTANNTTAKQDAIMDDLYEWIQDYGVNSSEGGWDQYSASPLAVWAVCAPQIARALKKWLAKQNLSDTYNTTLVTDNRAPGTMGRVFARIAGVSLVETPRVPTIGEVNSGANKQASAYQVIIGTRAGASFASLPPLVQLFSPRQNQSAKLGWLLRGTWFFDAWVQYANTFAAYEVPSGDKPA